MSEDIESYGQNRESHEKPSSNIGDRIKQIRQMLKLTQKTFATSLGISAGFVSDIEKGKKFPGSQVLISLKKTYNINLDWLLTGDGYMEPIGEAFISAAIVEEVSAIVLDFLFSKNIKLKAAKIAKIITIYCINIKNNKVDITELHNTLTSIEIALDH